MSTTEYTIFLTASFAVAVITFVMGIMAFSTKAKGAKMFSMVMISIAIWCFGIGGQMLSRNESASLNWIFVQMFGVILVPPFWYLFTIYFSGRENNLHWWIYPLLFLNSVIVYALLLVPDWRSFLVLELQYLDVNGYLVNAEWVIGPYFWVHMVSVFSMVVLGDVVILRHALQWPKTSRWKVITILIATLFPLFTNIALVFNFFPNIHGNIDVFGFAVTGIMLGVVLYMDRVLEIQPIAGRQLMEDLTDALLVFDANLDLVQTNPAAEKLFCKELGKVDTRCCQQLLQNVNLTANQPVRQKLVLTSDEENHHYDVLISPLLVLDRVVGYSMVLRDVTDLIESMNQLEQLATIDPLTGLHNRRYYHLEGERIYAQAIRYHHPVCVMTFDIDHFKQINDQYGHPAGDEVLKQVANLLKSTSRSVDIAARFGGDEFFILMPESTADLGIVLTQRLQESFLNTSIKVDRTETHISSSFGVASCWPTNAADSFSLDELMRVADQQLYQAKEQGRNQICSRSFDQKESKEVFPDEGTV